MKKRIFIAIFWLSIFGLYLAGSKYFNSAREPEMRESAVAFPIMSTQATQKIYAKDETEIENAGR